MKAQKSNPLAATAVTQDTLTSGFRELLIGQDDAIDAIVPLIHWHRSGLAPEGRPLGVVLLLGPTGTGKTKTVEALAEVLHGSKRNVLRIDCAEYQAQHEVARLVGAPPGFIGHRETNPAFTQAKINAAASENSGISIILLDEIEKAHESVHQLLLGVMDKATLTLGDSSKVDFSNCLIFMTSNLGCRALQAETEDKFGFATPGRDPVKQHRSTEIGMRAARKKFSPEFMNRIDHIVTYKPLSRETHLGILHNMMHEFARHIFCRLGVRAFKVSATQDALDLLIKLGTNPKYGARELKRMLHKHFQQPLAVLVSADKIPAGCTVVLAVRAGEFAILLKERE